MERSGISRIRRVTALWAMSEALLGGFLHAFHIPLTGIFINGTSVIFISLIGAYSEKRGEIFRSMIIVLIIKFTVAPYTPPAAYFSVFIQGFLGEFFFRFRKIFRIPALFLGVTTLTLSSIQKFLVFTLIYGMGLWESIDRFGEFISSRVSFLSGLGKLSLWIFALYTGMHIITGIITGMFAAGLPKKLNDFSGGGDLNKDFVKAGREKKRYKKRGRRRLWIRKPVAILITVLAFTIFILSYLLPEMSKKAGVKAMIMIVRSTIIMVLWFFFISPGIKKIFEKMLGKKRSLYGEEIGFITSAIPVFKSWITYSWKESGSSGFFRRIPCFIKTVLGYVLYSEIEDSNGN